MNDRRYLFIFLLGWAVLSVVIVTGYIAYQHGFSDGIGSLEEEVVSEPESESSQGIVNLRSPTGGEVTDAFDNLQYYVHADVDSRLEVTVIAGEELYRERQVCTATEIYDYEEGDIVLERTISVAGGQEIENNLSGELPLEGEYRWSGQVIAENGALLDEDSATFITSDEPEDRSPEECEAEGEEEE